MPTDTFICNDIVYVFFPAIHIKGLNGRYLKAIVLERKTDQIDGPYPGPRYSVKTLEADTDRGINEGDVFDDMPQRFMTKNPPAK
jgi:hypothetical protein